MQITSRVVRLNIKIGALRLRRTDFRFYKTLGLLCHFLCLRPEVHQVLLDEVLHVDALADDINHTIKIISNDNYFKKVCTFAA